jgi:aminoglycoside 6'-N-acetyltransferase I
MRDVVALGVGIALTERPRRALVERGPFNVRRAAPSDRDAWIALRVALWPEGSAHDHATDVDRWYFDPDGSMCLVGVERSGAVVGFIELSLRSYAEGCESTPVGYVEGWYVAPSARHLGVGRALMAGGEAWARAQGCREFASDTELGNVASQRAHVALGFAEVERIVCYRKSLLPDDRS